MRMVWLALLCLIVVATTVVVKIRMSPSTGADVRRAMPLPKSEVSRVTTLTNSMARSSENVTMGTVFRNEKADKVEVPTDEAALQVKPVKPIPLVLPTEEPKQLPKRTGRIVIRHWHDPLDKRRAAAQPIAKGKLSQRAQSADASIAPSVKMPSRDR